ncbi:pyrroline-5-carboxylate reductase dimerization domain-containing protein [uncultured Aureimonas sp.]|uniref:pyrroline-5-carboxylate reductase family protein n=1 Tax=uncultured Aureimonas sp. TaxID=1604662 RepID=UPI0025F4134B|nr:pyrroline-5-carboxylate reductase dimerization domain-containing protein [uncultured Aureimonas sp.]
MTIEQRIGIIVGNGWLGSAIASAAVAAGAVDPARLTVSGRSDLSTFPDLPGVHRTNSNDELVERSDVVILSVGPAQFADVRIGAAGKLVVSVMAGIPAARIAERTGAAQVVRAIPNAAAAIRRSFTPWFATAPVSASGKTLVQALFKACGEAAEVPDEGHIDYCVGMTGSGAAFPALLAEAMIAHAVADGLPRDFAERAAKGVVAGASQLLAQPGADAARVVREMIDYRGTTAAALLAMRERGFDEAVAAGLAAASEKAAAMSKA